MKLSPTGADTPLAAVPRPQRYGHEIAAIPQCLSRFHFDLHALPDAES